MLGICAVDYLDEEDMICFDIWTVEYLNKMLAIRKIQILHIEVY